MPGAFESLAFEPTAFEVGTGTGTSALAYARMLAALLPPGRLWRLIGGGVLQKVLTACADELARVDARAMDLLRESVPTEADELLPDYERELGLPSTGTTAERQARVLARTIARQRYRPADFVAALEPLLGAVTVIDTSHAQALLEDDVRLIYRFYVLRDPSQPGTFYTESAQDLVDAIRPSHTAGFVVEATPVFRYGDEHSLYGRDPMSVP